MCRLSWLGCDGLSTFSPTISTESLAKYQDVCPSSDHAVLVAAEAICERLDHVIALLEKQDASEKD